MKGFVPMTDKEILVAWCNRCGIDYEVEEYTNDGLRYSDVSILSKQRSTKITFTFCSASEQYFNKTFKY